MKKRRAQAAIFIVVALILVLALLLLQNYLSEVKLGTTQAEVEQQTSIAYEQLPFQQYVDYCLQETTEQGVLVLGKQGGFNTPPQPLVQLQRDPIPVYMQKGIDYTPTTKTIQDELAGYVGQYLLGCIQKQYEQATVAGSVQVSLSHNKISLQFSGNIKQHPSTEQEVVISNAHANLISNYGKLFAFAEKIIALQQETGKDIPMGRITEIAVEENVYFSFVQLNGESFVVVLKENNKDNETEKKNTFQFGMIYDWKA